MNTVLLTPPPCFVLFKATLSPLAGESADLVPKYKRKNLMKRSPILKLQQSGSMQM